MLNFGKALLVVACGGALWTLGEAAILSRMLDCPDLDSSTYPDTQFIFFRLFTTLNRDTPQNINTTGNNLPATNFNPTNPTTIMIHGFKDNYTQLMDVKSEYLIKGSYNLIMVDWSLLAAGNLACYPAIQKFCPYVGRNVAILVDVLRTAGATNIHIIGHSLGAHIAGFAANTLKPYNMTRITGLDPAGPYFETEPNTDRLDPTDAKFVDIFHTNIFGAGIASSTGHVDTYFNDGTYQPGCKLTEIGCSHGRAGRYFAESINTAVGFWGIPCGSFARFYLRMCGSPSYSILVGDNINISTRGIVAVSTKSSSLYAIGK